MVQRPVLADARPKRMGYAAKGDAARLAATRLGDETAVLEPGWKFEFLPARASSGTSGHGDFGGGGGAISARIDNIEVGSRHAKSVAAERERDVGLRRKRDVEYLTINDDAGHVGRTRFDDERVVLSGVDVGGAVSLSNTRVSKKEHRDEGEDVAILGAGWKFDGAAPRGAIGGRRGRDKQDGEDNERAHA